MLRLALLLTLALASPAFGMASHYGWPPREPGFLVMNKTDSSRPLDARPGFDPFGGQDPTYSCDELHRASSSCLPAFELADGLLDLELEDAIKLQLALVVREGAGHARLYGGHGDDTIRGGPDGDVIWGDYKPTDQTEKQHDRIWGGAGPDFIYASHGRNDIKAGPGSDSIHALYGYGTVDCGGGRDALYLPAVRGAYKLKNCEWKRKRFGESAPAWLLKKLPWPLADN